MVSALNTAVTGLHAATRRVEASASNIVNARNSIAPEDARVKEAAEPKEARDRPVYEPVRVHEESLEHGGVRSEFVPIEPPHVMAYAPDDRLADEDGFVARPNVDYATEIVNMKQAEHAYKANVKTIATENAMIGELLNETH